MPLLQGFRLFIDLDGAGEGKGALLHHLTSIIEAGGGLVVDHIADATHAVLRHEQQQAYQTALNIGTVSVVPPEWVILSTTQQQLQAERAGVLQGPGIPGMAEQVREVTLSGITGLDRVMTRYKVECTGCIYTAAMRLNATTHVISTAEACHTPSEKITAAMQHGIAVVSGKWLDHCLEAWQYVPEEPYRLIPQPHLPPAAQVEESEEPAAHFNPAAVEQAGASNSAVLQHQQQQQQPAVGQQQQQALAPGFVSQQQGTTQQQPSQRSDGFIPATLENLSSLQPPRPAPHSPAAPSGAVAPTSSPGARAAAGVHVSEGAEAKQALAASADEAGVDAAVAQYGYDAAAAAAAAAAVGEDGGGFDGGEMSKDVTEEPTQEPEYFEEAAGIEGEVDSHMHSPNAAAGATAAAPDAETAAAVVDSHAAPGVAADAVRPRPASTEPLDPTEVLEGDAAAVEDDGEPDVTSQATPLKQHAAPAPQQLQQDAAKQDDSEVVQGQHPEEPQQQQGELQQQEEEQQHDEQEQLGEERHWEGEDDGKGDLEALQQPHKPQLELYGAAAAAPAGPDEAGESEQPATASTPRLLSIDVLGAEAGPTAAAGAVARSRESPEQGLDVDAAGAQHVQQGTRQRTTPQQQQQQQEEVEEEVHAGSDAAVMAADDPGVGVPSLVFNMGTLANTSQGVLRADRFVDELIGDLAFPTDSESPVPKPTVQAPRPSRLQQQQQPQPPTVVEAPGGGSMHDLTAAPAAPSGGGSGGAASGRSSRSLGASGFKVAGLSRRRASAATPAAAPGDAAAEAAALEPVADLAVGEVEPAEGDDAPAAFPTNVPDPAADQTAAADDAGGRGRRTRPRAASASPRLARSRTAAGPAAAATPDAAGGDAATASRRQGSAPQQQTARAAQLLNGAAHSDKRSAATPQQQALDHAAQGAAGANPGTEQAEEQQQQEQPKARSRRSAGARASTASKATPKLVAARRQRLQQQETEQEPVAAKEQEQPHKTGRQRQQKQKHQRQQREAAGDSQGVVAAGPADDAGGGDEVDALLDEYLQVQDDATLPDEPPPPAAAAADVQPAKRRGSAAAKRPAPTTAAGKRKRPASNAIEQLGADGEQPPEAGVAGAAGAARSSRKRRKSATPAAAATPSVSQDIDDAAGNAAVPEASEEHHSPDVDAGGAAHTKGRGQAARRAASAAGAAVGSRAAYKRQQQQQQQQPPEEADSHDDQEATLAGQQQEEQAEMKSNRSRKQGRAAAKATSKQQQQQDTRAAPSELDVQPKRGRKRGMQQHGDAAEDAAGGAAGDAHTRQVSADDGAVLQPGSKRRTRAEQQQQQQQQQPQEVEDMREQEQEEEIPRPKRQRKQGLTQAQQPAGHLVSSEPGTSDDEAGTEPNQPQPAKRATAAKRLGQRSKAAAIKQPKTAPRAKRSGTAAAAAAAEPASPAAEPPASADTSPAVAGVTTPVVALSGMHSDERQRHAATLRRLRVRCLPTSHDWQVGTTHIVQPELKRGEKSLAGMAAGAWLVKQEWLVQSGAAGRLLDPEPYELEACETATGSIAEGAPMHWRVRRQALAAAADQPDAAFDAAGSYGAFAGLRVIFFGSSDAPSFASLARMLKAGGGQVLRKVPPYTSLLPAAAVESKAGRAKAARKARSSSGAAATGSQVSGTVNLAVIGPDKSSDDSVVSSLREAGVPCVSPAYLVDWLAQPWLSLEQHYLFGDQAAQSGELQQLEAARGAEGQGQQQSASF